MKADNVLNRMLGMEFDTFDDAVKAFHLASGRCPVGAEKDMLRSRVVVRQADIEKPVLTCDAEGVKVSQAMIDDLNVASSRLNSAISQEACVRANADAVLGARIDAAAAGYQQSITNLAAQLETLRLDQQANNSVEGSAAELSARIVEAMNLINSEELNNLDSLCAHDKATLQRIISAVKRALVA